MFGDALLESNRKPEAKGKAIALLAAFAAHVVVVAVVMVAQLFAIEELPEPAIMVSFWSAPAPPPPPPPPPPRAAAAAKSVAEVKPSAEVVQPQVIPQEIPQVAGGSGGVEGGVEGGIEGGELGGIVGGVPGGVPGVAPLPTPEPPIRIGFGQMKEPRKLVDTKPVYPETARRARLEGVVILEIIVDKQGSVRNWKVLRPLSLGLTEAAVAAVQQWKYEPPMYNGRPVEVLITVTMRFSLQ